MDKKNTEKKKNYLIIKKSIIIKINILMTIMVVLFFSIYGTVDYLQKTKTKTEDLHLELSIITKRLSKTLTLPIWDLDFVNMTDSILAEMQNKNIQTIIVYDAITNDILIGKTRDVNWEISDLYPELIKAQIIENHKVVYNNRDIAFLEVQVTDTFIKEEIFRSALSQAQRLIPLILIFIFVLSLTLFIAVLKPIRMLTNTVREITEGNINVPVNVDRNDELGELAKNFTVMQNTVKQKIDSLNKEILERKEIEEELHYLRNYLSNIIDSMPSILVGVNTIGEVTLWNRTAEQVTGISVSSATGQKLSDVFPQMALEMSKITESIQTHESKQELKKPRKSDNGMCYEDVTIYPLIANGIKGAVIRIDDVTDIVRMEEMMIQSEKMLSVGGLAAGMAHEINNPLAGMMQTANVMQNRLGKQLNSRSNIKAAEKSGISIEGIQAFMEERDILRMTQVIRESGERVAAIVNNILSFARKSNSTSSNQQISLLLDQTLDLAAADYSLKKQFDFKQIKIIKEYTANIPPVPCEETKIQQVLLNIFRNGSQAMQEAGTKNPQFIIRTYFEEENNMVCLEIEDNGPGIEEKIRKRVFEPFFTTKPVGEGTGLGLSVSYFIITENHKGEMVMESTLGVGSKFIIKLPV